MKKRLSAEAKKMAARVNELPAAAQAHIAEVARRAECNPPRDAGRLINLSSQLDQARGVVKIAAEWLIHENQDMYDGGIASALTLAFAVLSDVHDGLLTLRNEMEARP